MGPLDSVHIALACWYGTCWILSGLWLWIYGRQSHRAVIGVAYFFLCYAMCVQYTSLYANQAITFTAKLTWVNWGRPTGQAVAALFLAAISHDYLHHVTSDGIGQAFFFVSAFVWLILGILTPTAMHYRFWVASARSVRVSRAGDPFGSRLYSEGAAASTRATIYCGWLAACCLGIAILYILGPGWSNVVTSYRVLPYTFVAFVFLLTSVLPLGALATRLMKPNAAELMSGDALRKGVPKAF